MKKRLLALLTSAICCSAHVGNLLVSAEKPEGLEKFYQKDYYVVTFSNTDPENNHYYIRCNSKAMHGRQWYTRLDPDFVTITGEKTSGFSYGDILLIDAFTEVQLSSPPTYITYADSAEYIGNCKDVLETKELTLTKKDITSFFDEDLNFNCLDHIEFGFTDENGEEYDYAYYYYNFDAEVDVNTCNVGDKILASVYENTVVLPLEVYPDTTENLPGDIDGNGTVDITDVIQMNRVYVGCQKFTPEQQKAGDINQDGRIDLSDSMQVLRYLVGLDETLGALLN
ncbi:MAG: dockerin type I repeat-containing protein [Oscillospiraceae bacterium]|nr:dockerin type I repeat-containing protein [Oscillospiraceae bacterium]